jgi:hypothetical protein
MIREGLLWYDDDPKRGLAEKVLRAARRYQQKHGMAPNVCYVHASVVGDSGQSDHVDGVHVAVLGSVLRNHYWLGNEEELPAPVAVT